MDRKRSFPPYPTGTDNNMWETAAVWMSMAEEAIRNITGMFNAPVEFWGCTNFLRYHVERFNTYRNCPNKRDTDVAEREKKSIKEYAQSTSMMGVKRGDQDSQG